LLAIVRAEIEFTIDHESTIYPDDYFNRRSGKIYFDVESVENNFDFIIDEFARLFSWSDTIKKKEWNKCRELLNDVTKIKAEALAK